LKRGLMASARRAVSRGTCTSAAHDRAVGP
jgi:hypothetical protein